MGQGAVGRMPPRTPVRDRQARWRGRCASEPAAEQMPRQPSAALRLSGSAAGGGTDSGHRQRPLRTESAWRVLSQVRVLQVTPFDISEINAGSGQLGANPAIDIAGPPARRSSADPGPGPPVQDGTAPEHLRVFAGQAAITSPLTSTHRADQCKQERTAPADDVAHRCLNFRCEIAQRVPDLVFLLWQVLGSEPT